MKKRGLLLVVILSLVAVLAMGLSCAPAPPEEEVAPPEEEVAPPEEEEVAPPEEEEYPTRAIEVVNGHGPGSGSDMTLRAILPGVEEALGVEMPITYMPGGATAVAQAYVQKQPADGYTIFECSSDLSCGLALGRLSGSLDDWILIQCNTHEISCIHTRTRKAPAKPFADSWEEVVEYSQANPKAAVTVAGSGFMGIDHFWVSLLAAQSGANLAFVPYESGGTRRASSMGGHTDLHSDELIDMKGFRDAGQCKPILIGYGERLELFPDVPCTVELGIDNIVGRWRGVMVKKGTPQYIVDILIEAFSESFASESYQEYLWEERGHDRPSLRVGSEFQEFARSEIEVFEDLAKELGWLE